MADEAAAAGAAEEITRLRKPRFSYEENQILIQEVRAHYPQLYGPQSRRVTVAERRRLWEGIAAKINGVTTWRRTGQEVQKRWNDFKRRTKEKLARVPHSTQGAGGPANDDGPAASANANAFSAEEETIFAILGPGVVGGGGRGPPEPAGKAAPAPFQPLPAAAGAFGRRYLLADERRSETPARGKVCSSPEPSARASCCPLDGTLVRPKERDSPAPPPAPPPLQIIQLPRLAPSPAPSRPPARPGPSPRGEDAPSPPPPLDPSLDFLQAQRETTAAVRELAGALRQGLDKLSHVLATLLPLLPGPAAPGPPQPPPGPRPPKVEASPEPAAEGGAGGGGEEGGGARPAPARESPPAKRRKGFPTRKRRGRWKNL
ncbi:myb-related transcription factor, partner of profilin [Tachyglossus aculeatus]|uniref:myb-related transcription factor, partner of profilin n=1 Tax=Tachyglossus aculeatus TaxID=9261 RepID=UPI0018F71A5B|nr:myb-related transcription factor, partner of profilin [Tachyglossus aculeatus]